MAGIGAVSMITGSSPASAIAAIRARGVMPSRARPASFATSTAAAPSVIWLDVPAVSSPLSESGFNAAIAARLASARMPSSAANFSLVPSSSVTSTGAISRANRPSRVARAAYSWLARPKRSRSSRAKPQRSAIISAPANWLNFAPG